MGTSHVPLRPAYSTRHRGFHSGAIYSGKEAQEAEQQRRRIGREMYRWVSATVAVPAGKDFCMTASGILTPRWGHGPHLHVGMRARAWAWAWVFSCTCSWPSRGGRITSLSFKEPSNPLCSCYYLIKPNCLQDK